VKHGKEGVSITLPMEVWLSASLAISDYLRFGPGDLGAEYIPDEHLEKCRDAIAVNVNRVGDYFERKEKRRT
jgi:hypothetical protein